MTADELAKLVAQEASTELREALDKIKHCIGQLTEAQIWLRPQPVLNSIGNLMLHLAGNLTQWVAIGVGGGEDKRNRPAEFAERGPIPVADLLARLEDAVNKSAAACEHATAAELARVRRIQGFEVSGIGALFHSIPHFRGHTQEIIHMTRALLGDKYVIQFEPPEPASAAK
jgi:Protein of unknown function (DUF1572)